MDTRQVASVLRRGRKNRLTEILSIGIAGENQVPFACIMNGTDHAAGRTGLGAVMGSKNLKAILVQGVKTPLRSSSAEKSVIRNYIDKVKAPCQPIFDDFSITGSSGHIQWLNDSGQLGTKNYREGQFGGVEKIDGKSLLGYVTKKSACHRCPVRCKAEIKINDGRHDGFTGGRPEYETVINMGSLCGLDDPDELMYLANLSNILGMDTITTGSIIAFAMDLYDRGIITKRDTNGLDLTWETQKPWSASCTRSPVEKGLEQFFRSA